MTTSVALCTYNGEKFLPQQLDSILAQTKKVDEIVVCDDGSTDSTLQILENYNQKYPNVFKIYKNEINLRSVKNFEKAISLCENEIIFLSDQDDIWAENKVEKYSIFFQGNENINVLASNGFCIDENNKVHERYSLWDIPAFLQKKKLPVDYHVLISHIANLATGASVALRKNFAEKVNPFPILEGFFHDEWISLCASYKNSFALLDEKLFYYRIHHEQQVGGVFFEKTPQKLNEVLGLFIALYRKNDFGSYKRLLSKLSLAYRRKKELLNTNETQFKDLITKDLEEILAKYKSVKKRMQKEYPLQSLFLNTVDFFTKRRQIA